MAFVFINTQDCFWIELFYLQKGCRSSGSRRDTHYYGLLFSINVIFGWHLMDNLWPIFPLGVAIGLFQLYLFGGREKGLLIPVGILGAVSLFFLVNNLLFVDFRLIAGIILVLIGIWFIFKKSNSNNGTWESMMLYPI